ncbi:hypothetical protein COOONC_14975, partial [Cooperia oncophora]
SVPCQINKYKTKLCDKYTTTGLCPYGDRCLFIHPDHGTNAYIRPDKLVEVSRRMRVAMTCISWHSMDCRQRAGLPPNVGHLPGQPASKKTDEFRTPSPVDAVTTLTGGKGSWDELSTPARSSCGYVSGGSTPSGASPFSTVSSSSLHLNLTDDDRDFDLFNLTVGFDHIAQDLAKTLELW